MTKRGSIVRWDATRAFGLIRSADSAGDVFFCLRDCGGATPQRESKAPSPATDAPLAFGLMLVWAALLAWGVWTQRLSLWTLAALATLNAVMLWMYTTNKNAARAGRWCMLLSAVLHSNAPGRFATTSGRSKLSKRCTDVTSARATSSYGYQPRMRST